MTESVNLQPPAKRVKLSYDQHITVLVGPQETSFVAYEGIITDHSKFFAAACNGQFQESKERIVRLPEEDPVMFKSYLHWIYSGTVLTPEDAKGSAPSSATQCGVSVSQRFVELISFYVTADRLDDKALRNAIINAIMYIMKVSNSGPDFAPLSKAYQCTPETSTLRKLLLDWYRCCTNASWLKENRKRLPDDFIFDLAYTRKEKCDSSPWADRCTYHEHTEGEPKCT